MLQFAVCDDDKNICTQIEDILFNVSKQFDKKLRVDTFFACEQLSKALSDGIYYDVIFLDIEFEKKNGIELGAEIREELHNETTKIVSISGKDSYAMDLFKIRPFDFLLKPIKSNEIERIIRKVVELMLKKISTI